MYAWHGKHYLGAAHGLAGILTLLLQVRSPSHPHTLTLPSSLQLPPSSSLHPRICSLVRPCVEWLRDQQFPSGNLPSSLESGNRDRLVQWCHGAPGLVHLMAQAYRVSTFRPNCSPWGLHGPQVLCSVPCPHFEVIW